MFHEEVQKTGFERHRVIVVGGSGFIGSHIARLLIENDHNALIVDEDSFGACAQIEKNVQQINSNNRTKNSLEGTNICLADAKEVQDMINIYKPTAIINAYTSTHDERTAELLPGMVIKEVIVQANLLNAIQHYEKMSFVYISSDDVYGSKYNGDPAVEYDSALQPETCYGVFKKTAESMLMQTAMKKYGLSATVLRTASVYGPGGLPQDSVVNAFLESVARNQSIIVHGDGSTVRDFVFVKDVAEMAVIAVLRRVNGIFNASTGIETTISQLLSHLKQFGQVFNTEFVQMIKPKIGYKCLRASYGREVTGVPITHLLTGIKETYEDIENRILENMVLH